MARVVISSLRPGDLLELAGVPPDVHRLLFIFMERQEERTGKLSKANVFARSLDDMQTWVIDLNHHAATVTVLARARR